jgi:hypothetical protein
MQPRTADEDDTMSRGSAPVADHIPTRPAAERPSIDAQAGETNRGRGRQVLACVAGAVLLVAAGLLALRQITRSDAYIRAATDTARIEREHFDGFFGCILPGARPSELNAEQVHFAFESVGDRFGKSYAKTLQRCLPRMHALSENVNALRVPSDVEAQRTALVVATTALTSANTQYLRYLSATLEYEFVAAMPMLEKFGAASAGYRAAQSDLQRALDERW